MNFFEELYSKRKKLADVLNDEEYSGIRKIVEDLYPDKAHFIYELLQNAEDTGATEVEFMLTKDKVIFEHNGRPFNENDVSAITNIGKGTKEDEEDKIGRFGIGFKSVFAYTETPHIYSPTFSFKITNLVLPTELPKRKEIENKTRFEFPLNNNKKPKNIAYEEIKTGLEQLDETTLLFLSNIKSIVWKIEGDHLGRTLRIDHSKYHIEILKKISDEKNITLHFLRFSAPVDIDEKNKQNISIAYKLEFLPDINKFDPKKDLPKQLKIVSANPGRVAVYFPAEKEVSGLRFHVHAPFVPELSRASIREISNNLPLFEKLAELSVLSLHHIRDIGLLTVEFLGVLPNSHDNLPNRYAIIRDLILKAMINKSLTPTYSKLYAPAKYLIQSKANLKELLSEEDIEYLVEYEEVAPQWAIAATQRNSNQDRFIEDLKIEQWGIKQLINLLKEKASEKEYYYSQKVPDEQFMHWLSNKSVEWHQQLYALLYKELIDEAIDEYKYKLTNLKIVRLFNGSYSVGKDCYFPSDDVEDDEVLPRVDSKVYQSGKKGGRQDESKEFLLKIGVKEVGEEEEIVGILKTRYSKEAKKPGKKIYLKDLKRFIKFVDENQNKKELFNEYFIFKNISDEWHVPADIFIDTPLLQTDLRYYYNALNDENEPTELSNEYKKYNIENEEFLEFAKTLGVVISLKPIEVPCCENPEWERLCKVPGTKVTNSSINTDYTIKGLEKLFKSPRLELSRLVWKTMCEIDEKYLEATFSRNYSSGCKKVNSQLVYILKDSDWVPQKNENFVKPCNALRDQLPKKFSFDEGKKWIKLVEFEKTEKEQSEEDIQKDNYAQQFGFKSSEEISEFKEVFKNNGITTPDDLKTQLKRNEKPDFPNKKILNPERREEQVSKQYNESTDKEYKKTERNVRTTSGTIDKEFYLRNLYTNETEQMVCQICQNEMPFKKRDGEYYFEAVEAFTKEYFSKEYEAQYLALCPLCSAMYKEFIKRNDESMKKFVRDLMESKICEIPLKLGEKSTKIKFVESHWYDVRTICVNTE